MNIGEVLIENIPQLWMGMVGILLNSIVVGTLFGKRKYDWFFLVICSVRFIIYNIGFLAIGNAMYGNETWYKITMSTFATVTALGVGIATAVLWQESLAKTLTGILAAECVNDGIVYQAISLNILPILEYMGVFIVFTILYFILRPLMKRYRSYQLKHEVVCLTGVLGFFGIGWFSNFLYNTSASLRERLMQMVADSFIIGGGGALIIAFSIYTIKIFKRKEQLEVNRKRMEEYYSQIQNQAGELEEIQNEMAVKLDELSNLSVSSKKEKKQKYRYYIEELKERYNHLNQYFFCKDYLVDGILSDFVQICNQKGIETDILFQNYHRGRISEEDVMEILLQLMEYGKQADAVKLHGTVIKNQLVILLELKTEHKSIKFNKKDFKRYITQYEGGIYLEREDEKISVVVGLQI